MLFAICLWPELSSRFSFSEENLSLRGLYNQSAFLIISQNPFLGVGLANLEIVEMVGGEEVLATVSGGVDSTVMAKILSVSLPEDQLILVTIDDGARREGEVEWVAKTLLKCLELPIKTTFPRSRSNSPSRKRGYSGKVGQSIRNRNKFI